MFIFYLYSHLNSNIGCNFHLKMVKRSYLFSGNKFMRMKFCIKRDTFLAKIELYFLFPCAGNFSRVLKITLIPAVHKGYEYIAITFLRIIVGFYWFIMLLGLSC